MNHQEQLRLCRELLAHTALTGEAPFDEGEWSEPSDAALTLRVDIGASTISAALIECGTGHQVEAFRCPTMRPLPAIHRTGTSRTRSASRSALPD